MRRRISLRNILTITYALMDEFAVCFDKIIAQVRSENGYVEVLKQPYDFFQYIFTGWDTNGDEIADIDQSEMLIAVNTSGTYQAVYKSEISVPKIVSVTNGSIQSISDAEITDVYKVSNTNYYTIKSSLLTADEYGSKYTIELNAIDVEGKNFQGWYKKDVAGKYILISTRKKFSAIFAAKDNVSVIAMYSDAVETKETSVIFSNFKLRSHCYDSRKQKAMFVTCISLAGDANEATFGIIRTYNKEHATAEFLIYEKIYDDISLHQTSAKNSKDGVHTITINIGASSANRFNDIYYRCFVRYKTSDSDGYCIKYTDINVLKTIAEEQK